MISFRPVVREDIPILYQWLQNPDVALFYDDGRRLSSVEYEAKILHKISSPTEYSYIILIDEREVWYIQCYLVEAENPIMMSQIDDPSWARAMDMFIGEDEYRGKGYGSVILRQFVTDIILSVHHARAVYIDPYVTNVRAIKAYTKAWFLPVKEFHDGGGDSLLMRYNSS